MARWTVAIVLLACILGGVPGCAKSADSNQSGAVRESTLCHRLAASLSDLGGILSAPITGSRIVPGDAQSCEFLTESFAAITVSIRPGLGRTTLDAWITGRMPLAVSSLTGVGDAAVWQDALHEVLAQKNDLLCDIQVHGGAEDIAHEAQTLPAAVGALCNRIFAAQ